MRSLDLCSPAPVKTGLLAAFPGQRGGCQSATLRPKTATRYCASSPGPWHIQQILETSDVTRSPAQEAARLLSVHKILEAADLAQQAQDWELTTKLIEIAFAVLDEPSEPNEASLATGRFE